MKILALVATIVLYVGAVGFKFPLSLPDFVVGVYCALVMAALLGDQLAKRFA
jgi:hypothetical protein